MTSKLYYKRVLSTLMSLFSFHDVSSINLYTRSEFPQISTIYNLYVIYINRCHENNTKLQQPKQNHPICSSSRVVAHFLSPTRYFSHQVPPSRPVVIAKIRRLKNHLLPYARARETPAPRARSKINAHSLSLSLSRKGSEYQGIYRVARVGYRYIDLLHSRACVARGELFRRYGCKLAARRGKCSRDCLLVV